MTLSHSHSKDFCKERVDLACSDSPTLFPLRAGLLPASKPLGLCLYLLKETEVVPWASALRHLGSWKLLLRETDLVPKINGLIRHLISPIYNKLGWEDEGTHLEK